MTAFEFVFPLFGLLVGLTYTEMLSGLARALKSSRHVRIGWLVPLLGVLVLINLTMFWYGAWQMRHLDSHQRHLTADIARWRYLLSCGVARIPQRRRQFSRFGRAFYPNAPQIVTCDRLLQPVGFDAGREQSRLGHGAHLVDC
jgi:hypothetical protein